MTNTWFECKIKYERTMENGFVKKVTEPYLVEAISFTEAEARIIEEISPYMTGEFQVSDIKRVHYAEIFETEEDSADRWFKAKLTFITLDEKSGKEKRSSHNVLIQAADLRGAIERLDEGMKGSLVDYVISSITETAIMDVYHYVAGTGEGKMETSVEQFLSHLREGEEQSVTVGGKKMVICRQSSKILVRPGIEENSDDKG